MGNETSKLDDAVHHKKKHRKSQQSDNFSHEVETFFKVMGQSEHGLNLISLKKYFENMYFFELILKKNATMTTSGPELDVPKAKIVFNSLFHATTTSSIFELYLNLIFGNDERISYESLNDIIRDCFNSCYKLIGYNQAKVSSYSKNTLENIVNSIKFNEDNGQKMVSKNILQDWIIDEFPQLFFGFHNWILKKIKNIDKHENTQQELENSEDLSMLMNQAFTWYLVFNLPGVYTKSLSSDNGTILEKFKNCCMEKRWKKLYISEDHGLSLNRLQSSLFNYKAPTIMLIYLQSGYLYCVGSTSEYKQSPTAYGDNQTKIFCLWPTFKSYDVTPDKNIYMNTKSKGLQQGLIFGYSQLKPTLKIDESLHYMEHEGSKKDMIISIEIWGCGTMKEANYQQDIKKWEDKNKEKMRTAKLNENWGENADKNLLELAGIKTEHAERGDF